MQTIRGVQVSIEQLIALRQSASRLDLHRRRQVNTDMQGDVQSKLRGRGMDFSEVRAYQAGDDIRHMDWRVTARTGVAHTKIHCEERERPVYLVVDYSPSMFFGTKVAFKSVIASQVAALLGWATIQNGDRLGAFIFSSMQQIELRPKLRERGIMALLQQLVELSVCPSLLPATVRTQPDIAQSLSRLRRVAKPGCLIFLISDFNNIHTNEEAQRHLSHLAQKSEVIACMIKDPLEVQLPPANHYGISDGEKLCEWNCDTPYARRLYENFQAKQAQKMKLFFQQRKIPLINLLTSDPIIDLLQQRLGHVA